MITEEQLRKQVKDTVYQKAVKMVETGKVEKLRQVPLLSDDDDGENEKQYQQQFGESVHWETIVRGYGSVRHNVDFVENVETGYISGAYCDCADFWRRNGICEHCAAAILQHIRSFDPEDNIRTSRAISDLLETRYARHAVPFLEDKVRGNVLLEPYLYDEGEDVYLELRVGIPGGRMYVVKSIRDFLNAVEQNKKLKYGKNLEFIHSAEAFDERCKPLLEEVTRIRRQRRSRRVRQTSYWYSTYSYIYSDIGEREERLSVDEAIKILRLMGDQEVHFKKAHSRNENWHVTEEAPKISLTIEGKESGAVLRLTCPLYLKGDDETAFFDNEKIYLASAKGQKSVLDFCDCFPQGSAAEKLYLGKEDVPAFCRDVLPSLEKGLKLRLKDFEPEQYGLQPVTFEIYLDMPQDNMVTCSLRAVYGEKKYEVFAQGEMDRTRDAARELEVSHIVDKFFNAYDRNAAQMVLADDEDKLYNLLDQGIPLFQTLGTVYVSDALKAIRITSSPKVTVGISLSGDLLELELTSGDMPLDQLQEILSRYDRKKKYYRLKSGEFVNLADSSMDTLMDLKEGLALTDSQLRKGKISVPKYRALYLDAESGNSSETLTFDRNRAFRSLVRNMKTVEDNDFEVPEGMKDVLRGYQRTGFLWIKTLHQNGFGGILADEMGLGKTIQVIAYLLSEQEEQTLLPSIIVCPASLVYNWEAEIERFAPSLETRVITGSAAAREELISGIKPGEIILTSYDLLKRDLEQYEEWQFACEIIDEAQYIKNYNTQAAKAVKELRAGFKLALTGTPIENRLSELWSIFDYLMPGFLYTYTHFRGEYEQPIVTNNDKTVTERLRKMIRPFVLRRLKKDVLKDLPDKLEENYITELQGEQQELYDANVKRLMIMLDKNTDEEFSKNKIQILAELTRLRQLCCDPALVYEDYKGGSAKLQLCLDLVRNAVAAGHKILLFSQFTTMLDRICDALAADGISHYLLTGSTSKEKRAELVDAFQNDDISVFCISLKAGGTGLNLTAADIVIHYDPWWNLAAQNQATDRTHRIGQKNVVNVYRLIAKGTIEEKIVKLQERKMELADQLMNAEGIDSGKFTREELMEILKA